MKETDIQLEILRDVRRLYPGTWGFKLSNQFLAGKPDLFIAAPGHNPVFLEVKYEKAPKKARPVSLSDITALQWKNIREARAAGLKAGWAMVLERGNGMRCMAVGYGEIDPVYDPADPAGNGTWWLRGRGESWSLPFVSMRL